MKEHVEIGEHLSLFDFRLDHTHNKFTAEVYSPLICLGVPQLSCRDLRAAVLLFERTCGHAGASANPVRYAEGCGKGHLFLFRKNFAFFCLSENMVIPL